MQQYFQRHAAPTLVLLDADEACAQGNCLCTFRLTPGLSKGLQEITDERPRTLSKRLVWENYFSQAPRTE